MTMEHNLPPLLAAETPAQTEAFDHIAAVVLNISNLKEAMFSAENAAQEACDLEGRSRKALLRILTAAYEIYLLIRRDPAALEAFMRRAARGGGA